MRLIIRFCLSFSFLLLLFATNIVAKEFAITSTTFEKSAKDISRYLPISIDFNDEIDKITLIGNVKLTKAIDKTNIDFSKEIKKKNKLTIKPTNPLENATKYTLEIKNNIKSANGNKLSNPKTINFITTTSVGQILKYKGKAIVKRNSKDIQARLNMSIKNKDILQTQKNTKLKLKFDDNTIVTIGSETIFKINDYLNDSKVNFEVQRGYFKTISGKIGKISPENFLFKTKTALIGVRGTIFEGNIGNQKDGGDFISCYDGEISVTSLKSKKTLFLKKYQGVHVNDLGNLGEVQTVTLPKYKTSKKY